MDVLPYEIRMGVLLYVTLMRVLLSVALMCILICGRSCEHYIMYLQE